MLSNPQPQPRPRPRPALARWALGLLCAPLALAIPVAAALNSYSRLDVIGPWVIERKQSDDGAIQCRASIPTGGTWFGSNVRLNAEGALVVPPNLSYPANEAELTRVREAVRRCQSDLLYQP